MPASLPAAAPRLRYRWRMAWFLLSLVFVGVGVACMIRAELGVAPYDVLVTGVAHTVGCTPGAASIGLAGLFIVAGTVAGGRPGLGTVLAMFLVGPILDAAIEVIGHHDAMAVRVPLFVGGVLLVATGISGVVAARVGAGPVELLMLALHEVRALPLAPVRTAMEVSFVAAGWVLGGQVGVGTIVFAAAAGPLLRAILRLMRYPGPSAQPVDAGVVGA